jgi:hypothetical protein
MRSLEQKIVIISSSLFIVLVLLVVAISFDGSSGNSSAVSSSSKGVGPSIQSKTPIFQGGIDGSTNSSYVNPNTSNWTYADGSPDS